MSLELIGRLQLWASAIRDSQECLHLARRFLEAPTEPENRAQETHMQQEFLAKTGRELDLQVALANDVAPLNSLHQKLPTAREYQTAVFHLHKLAVVYFMQIYTSGRGEPEMVASNRQAVGLLGEIEEVAFPSSSDLVSFRSLVDDIKAMRNGQIAHADGTVLGVHHDQGSVTNTSDAVSDKVWKALEVSLPQLLSAVTSTISKLIAAKESSLSVW